MKYLLTNSNWTYSRSVMNKSLNNRLLLSVVVADRITSPSSNYNSFALSLSLYYYLPQLPFCFSQFFHSPDVISSQFQQELITWVVYDHNVHALTPKSMLASNFYLSNGFIRFLISIMQNRNAWNSLLWAMVVN